MWTEKIDLHCHSTYSDGCESVEEMANRAHANGVEVWSLTDHDTDSGWDEGWAIAEKLGMKFIPGVEITCAMAIPADPKVLEEMNRSQPHSWHLLAYFPEGGTEDLSIWLREQKDARLPRMKEMLAKLSDHGFEISLEEVSEHAEGALGRPHLARVLVEKGIVDNFSEAFEKWIGDDGPAFAPRPLPTIEEAVDLIKSAGGFCSLAHPMYYGVETEKLVKYLRDVGVDAIEAFHRSHPDSYRFELMTAGLPITVGGDSHGMDHNPNPGRMAAPLARLHPRIIQ